MDSFINREPELRLIEDAFGDLLNKDTFLRTPIIDFYGVEGIGKTSILRKVIQTCDKNKIRYIWADASKNVPDFFHEIIHQAGQYGELLPNQNEGKDLLRQSIAVTQRLLGTGPLVMLLDAVDTMNDTKLQPIATMLGDLVVNNKLFVVLTSRRSVSFEHKREVARKLTTLPLLPLDRDSSEQYLNSIGLPPDPELREIIFKWTRGYPLAMNVMVNTLTEKVDPRNELGQRTLLTQIKQKVINEGILARVELAERPWFQIVLSLLSVPRRFNVVIMQNLIEEFAPSLKLANSLSYIVLPKRISQATDILSWNLAKGGFSIDSPVRNIFLLQLKIERPDDYHEINRFLVEISQSNANDASGPDRIRYQREYLYHSANSCTEEQLPHILATTVQQIIQEAEKAPEDLIQFQEEFSQDTELKELLGKHVDIVLSPIYQQLARKMYKDAIQEADEAKHVHYLHAFFSYTVQDPAIHDLSSLLKEQIDQLIAQERPAIVLKLYEKLARDDRFREALGKDFSELLARIRNNMPAEG